MPLAIYVQNKVVKKNPSLLDLFTAYYLVAYFIMLWLVAFPILILEVGLGQFMSQGGIMCWNIMPIMKGMYDIAKGRGNRWRQGA